MNTTDTAASLIGNRYRLIGPLASGGMGTVYRAWDRLNSQSVALKRVLLTEGISDPSRTMPATEQSRVGLAQEFRTLASLRHPNIINVLDYGFDAEQHPYFTMALLEGGQSLTVYGHQRSLPDQIDLLIQTLHALAYVHRLGILHRDLKPDNVLVVNGQVRVLDFGLSVARNLEPTAKTGGTAGTLAYMAPEILQGDGPSEAADLYAVGVMAYEMFTGVHPYQADTQTGLLENILLHTPDMSLLEFRLPIGSPLNPFEVRNRLVAVISRLLEKSPSARYSDANRVIADLCAALDQPIPAETGAIRGASCRRRAWSGAITSWPCWIARSINFSILKSQRAVHG